MPAMVGLCIIGIAAVIAIGGYAFTPDKTPYSNDQKPELHIKPPGFSVKMLNVRRNDQPENKNYFKTLLFGEHPVYDQYPVNNVMFRGPDILIETYSESKGERLGFNLADVVYDLDLSFPVVYDSLSQAILFRQSGETTASKMLVSELCEAVKKNHIVNKKYALGTDLLGRDLLSRLMIGTRISLSVGIISVLISIVIGVLLGAIAGYYRGTADVIITWFINVVWSIPTLLLVIAITLVLGKGITQVFIAVGLTMWVEVARMVRGQVLAIREKEFIEAARALGYRNGRIIFRHVLPNVMGPVIVIAAGNFASAILIEAGLSFLGIGAQPPVPSWGEMMNAHHGYILMDKAYLAFIPGAAIMLLVLSFMLVGNGLRDALDTRSVEEVPMV